MAANFVLPSTFRSMSSLRTLSLSLPRSRLPLSLSSLPLPHSHSHSHSQNACRSFSIMSPAFSNGASPVQAGDGGKKPKVLLLDDILLAKKDLERLASKSEVVRAESKSREDFIKDLQGRYSDISAIYRHFGGARSIKVTGRFDQELVEKLPPSLKFIAHNGAGYDQIDINACTSRSIQVSNVPTAVDESTSDTALFLMLGALRNFSRALSDLRSGVFNSSFDFRLAHDPQGKTVGIVGMGGIGRAFARKAAALGMRVQYHNRTRLSSEVESACGNAEYVSSLDDLLATSDVLSLHCPLTPATRHLISTAQLSKMKSSAILINTSRGPVVDESALASALSEGTIAGAGLDVYEHEPKISDALLKCANAFLLPHVGTLTLETQTEMEAVCVRNLEAGLEKGKLAFWVPEQREVFGK